MTEAVLEAPTLKARLDQEMSRARFGVGAQAVLKVGGQTIFDYATGEGWPGQPMEASHLANVWCATRPLLALTFGHLHDASLIDLEAPISAQTAQPPFSRIHMTPADILAQRVALTQPGAAAAQFLSPSERRTTALDAATAGGEGEVGYSEFVGCAVLGSLVLAVTGQTAATHAAERILDPLMLNSDIRLRIAPDELRGELRGRILPYYVDLPANPRPSYHDRSETVACSPDLFAAGGFVTMRGLTSLYGQVVRCLRGEPAPGLPSAGTVELLFRIRSGVRFDPTLGRPASFAAGFMVDLGVNGFGGSPSSRAFGHVGLMACSFALADPANDLAMAVFLNGLDNSPAELQNLRSELVGAAYDDAATGR